MWFEMGFAIPFDCCNLWSCMACGSIMTPEQKRALSLLGYDPIQDREGDWYVTEPMSKNQYNTIRALGLRPSLLSHAFVVADLPEGVSCHGYSQLSAGRTNFILSGSRIEQGQVLDDDEPPSNSILEGVS